MSSSLEDKDQLIVRKLSGSPRSRQVQKSPKTSPLLRKESSRVFEGSGKTDLTTPPHSAQWSLRTAASIPPPLTSCYSLADTNLSSLDFWDYSVELECLKANSSADGK